MKNGQMQQIFTWIFILILAVTVLFFGIKTVRQGEDFKDEVLLIDFYKNLEKKINDFYFLDIGSSGREDFILPSEVTRVCFINPTYNVDPDDYMESLKEFSNVFVFPVTEFRENRFNATRFFVENNNHTCATVRNDRVEIRFENRGNEGVLISQ